MKVLDLFSGTGGWSRAFSEAGDEVITIDLDPCLGAVLRLGLGEGN